MKLPDNLITISLLFPFILLLNAAKQTVSLELWLQNRTSQELADQGQRQYYVMLDCGGMQYRTCCSTSGLSQGSTLMLYWGKSWTTLALCP